MPDNWPIPKFQFQVIIDGEHISFTEVSGLDMETQVIEYRHGNNQVFSAVKTPGIAKNGNVTLKKGVLAKDSKFWSWFSAIKMNTLQRKEVVINLLDEKGTVAMSWKLTNAWPSKVTGTDLKADGNEVAVETIELAHEGILIESK
ncbi:MAG: phage tail protein [Ferruginibacter sp.]